MSGNFFDIFSKFVSASRAGFPLDAVSVNLSDVIFQGRDSPMMPISHSPETGKKPPRSRRPIELHEILQSLRLVLEMEPDHLDGAIDLLDEAIDIDHRKTPRLSAGPIR